MARPRNRSTTPQPPEKKRGPGRPVGYKAPTRFIPDAQQRASVMLAAAYRIPEDEMVQAVINPFTKKPISLHTLRKHFHEEIHQGYVNGKMRLMAATFQSATGVKNPDGTYLLSPNVTAQIWLGKILYGFHETVAVEPPASLQSEGEKGELTLEAARRVAFTLALGARMIGPKKKAD